MSAPRISIIIPTLNEAGTLRRAIASARAEEADEVIVADGGSTDATRRVATAAGARVIAVSPPQRARQMNAGAAAATGDLLVFLHADTILLPGSLEALRATARNSEIVGGGFWRRYRSGSVLLAVSSLLGNERARRLGWCFGDQAIWARRAVFLRLGGYPEKPLFEDLDFTRKLRRVGRIHLIVPGVETSARRFRDGTVSRLLGDILLTVHHVCRTAAR
ncbi:MAG: hypothetical protein PWP23_2937 [Candidatus Sumerlaeota bacterium]|nr:hypothetical protein [Candidatus Sumerlaeota bacterium]